MNRKTFEKIVEAFSSRTMTMFMFGLVTANSGAIALGLMPPLSAFNATVFLWAGVAAMGVAWGSFVLAEKKRKAERRGASA